VISRGNKQIWIYDFNVNPRVSQPMTVYSTDGDLTAQSFVIKKPETVVKPSLFMNPIITHLPFRLTRRTHQANVFGFMIDEERLIELQVSGSSKTKNLKPNIYLVVSFSHRHFLMVPWRQFKFISSSHGLTYVDRAL
jgi:hypothetical protein